MNRKLTDNQWVEIHLRIDKGESITALSREYKISRNNIYVHFRNNPTKLEKFKKFIHKFWIKKHKDEE